MGARPGRGPLLDDLPPGRAVPGPQVVEDVAGVEAAVEHRLPGRRIGREAVVSARRGAGIGEEAPGGAVPGPGAVHEVLRLPATDEDQPAGHRVGRELEVVARLGRIGLDLGPRRHVPFPRRGLAGLLGHRDAAVPNEDVALGIPPEAGHHVRDGPVVRQQLPGARIGVPGPHRLAHVRRPGLGEAVHQQQPLEPIGPRRSWRPRRSEAHPRSAPKAPPSAEPMPPAKPMPRPS